jgi:transcription initiation factor TFIID subunit 6
MPQLKEDVQSLLCHDSEYRVREIVQEAVKFMQFSNRQKLSTEDIQAALKLKHVQVFIV